MSQRQQKFQPRPKTSTSWRTYEINRFRTSLLMRSFWAWWRDRERISKLSWWRIFCIIMLPDKLCCLEQITRCFRYMSEGLLTCEDKGYTRWHNGHSFVAWAKRKVESLHRITFEYLFNIKFWDCFYSKLSTTGSILDFWCMILVVTSWLMYLLSRFWAIVDLGGDMCSTESVRDVRCVVAPCCIQHVTEMRSICRTSAVLYFAS